MATARLSRREMFKLAAAGVVGFSQSGWLESLAADTAGHPQRRRACILLWMNGGPSQTDTFDLKPGHANGGPFREIQTSVPGIRISEHLPKLARNMEHMAIIRSMSSREGEPVIWLNRIGLTWFGAAFYLLLLALALGLVGWVAGRFGSRERVLRVGTPLVVLATAGITAYGTHEADQVAITETTVASPDVPASADGLRVALITDLHVGPIRGAELTQRVVDLVEGADVDLVVLGGDLADGTVRHVGETLDPLGDLTAPTYAVTGNHEYISGEPEAWVEEWERLGITALRNASERLPEGIVMAGVEDASGASDRYEGGLPPDFEAALEGAAPDDFVLLAAHQPAEAAEVPDDLVESVDLVVSGHTHGGQLWPFGYAVLAEQGTIAGLDEIDDIRVLTSRGAGAWGPPLRVLAPPEVPVITLQRG